MNIKEKFSILEEVLPYKAYLFNTYGYELNDDNTITRYVIHIDHWEGRPSLRDGDENIGHVDALYEKYSKEISKLNEINEDNIEW